MQFDLDLGKELKVAEVAPPVSESSLPHVFMMTFDLQSGKATRRRVAPAIGDFPTIPPRLTGRFQSALQKAALKTCPISRYRSPSLPPGATNDFVFVPHI